MIGIKGISLGENENMAEMVKISLEDLSCIQDEKYYFTHMERFSKSMQTILTRIAANEMTISDIGITLDAQMWI